MKPLLTRQNLGVGLVLLALLLPLALVAAYLVGKYRWVEATMADVEPRYARLLGLEASQPELNQAIAQSAALLSRRVYPATLDVSQAGNDAQQRIRNIATRAGLSIMSSQVLPPKAAKQFDRVPLTVRLEGELPALQAALVVLAGESPAISFESFSVQTIGAVKSEVPQRLNIQMNLFILRAKS
jgi:general secretion pathway protein M